MIVIPYDWAGLDVGICAQNMMLAAKPPGLDSCPVGLAKYVEQTCLFCKLRVSSTDQVQLAVILGYGDGNTGEHTTVKDNAFFIDKIADSFFKKTILL